MARIGGTAKFIVEERKALQQQQACAILIQNCCGELINYALRIVSVFPFLLGTFHWNELRVPFDFQPNFQFSFFVQMANAPIVTCSRAFFRAWYSHWFHLYVYSDLSVITLVLSISSLVQNLQRKWAQAFSATTSGIA